MSIPNEPPRLTLAALPTPLVRLLNLEKALGRGASVWMKRDDLTGLEFSGNKIRKLEYILAAMRAAGHNALITEGTCQSNHCRATAAACARLGIRARLLFRPLPPKDAQGNHLLDRLFGAEVRAYSREEFRSRRDQIFEQNVQELRAAGLHPRCTPAGASEPLGCWGYIRAAFELAEQLAMEGIRACDLVVALSSGGTYAGLLLGSKLVPHCPWSLHAVPVSDDVEFHRQEIERLCIDTISAFKLPLRFERDWLSMVDGYVGEGYAVPYPRAVASLKTLAAAEAILLDPVYTAKAFCALLEGVTNGSWGRDKPVVFLHTGGGFSNFAWPDVLLSDRAGA